MKTVIQNYLNEAKIGRKQSHRNLAMFPLLSSYTVGQEYITLDEALSRGLIEVVERDEAGSVPELNNVVDKVYLLIPLGCLTTRDSGYNT